MLILQHFHEEQRWGVNACYLWNIKTICQPWTLMLHLALPSCRHNVLIVFHRITGSNRQTPYMGPNKPSCQGRGLTLIPFVTTHTQSCRYCPLWTQKALTALKCVYMIKRSSYLYTAKNFPPYPMWNVTLAFSCL